MKREKYVVDRIEDSRMLVLVNQSDDSEIVISKEKFSVDICESDILSVTFENGIITGVTVEKDETEQKKIKMKEKISSLFDNI